MQEQGPEVDHSLYYARPQVPSLGLPKIKLMTTVLLFRKEVMFFKIKTVRARAMEMDWLVPLHGHGDLSLSSRTHVKQLSVVACLGIPRAREADRQVPRAC